MKIQAIKKIIFIIFIISTFMNYTCPTVKALDALKNAINSGKDFMGTEADANALSTESQTGIIKLSKDTYKLLMTVGLIVASIIILVLGIQFMTGSIEQKAKVKEMLIPFLIGCVVVFGSLTIWKIVVNSISTVV